MDPLQKKALRTNCDNFKNDLLVDEILPHLVACGLLTDQMEESVMSHSTRLQKVAQLLIDLPRRGPGAFPLFVECLVHSGQKHLADAIQDTLTQLQHSASQTNYPHKVLPINDPEDEFIYKMTSKPRGYALIINNRYFHGQLQLRERLGTDVDRDNLQNLFKALKYNVTVFDNMKGQEMENAMRGFSMRDSHRHVDSTIVVLLSHGSENVIYGTDCVPVEIDKLIKCFDGAHCPALRGKPKWFVIQACRGESFNCGFEATFGETWPCGRNVGLVPATRTKQNVVGPLMLEQLQEMHVRDTENLRHKLPEEVDMLVAYSTVPGNFNSGFEATDSVPRPSGRDAGPFPATWTRQNVVHLSMLEQLQAMHVQDTENLRQKLPEGADMLVSYATVPGFVSWINSKHGSWFIQELCTALYEYAHTEDLLSMTTVINNRVATAYESACNKKQMPAPVSTLRKKWFFYPTI